MVPKANRDFGIHWKTPTVLLTSFVAGALLVVGHNLFYRSLDGKFVDDIKYDQQTNFRVGTAFSFLVRASLVTAIGASYWQVFWCTILKKPLQLSAIDSLAGLLGTLTDFFSFAAFRANPFLFFLATISWLIPFAAIVPPATLTIVTIPVISYSMRHLSIINFETGPLAHITFIHDNSTKYPTPYYIGPSQALSRVAQATALQGELPNLINPAINSSYNLKLDAPAVQCNEAPVELLSGFDAPMKCSFLECQRPEKTCCPHEYLYISWTPSSNLTVPYRTGSMQNGFANVDGSSSNIQPYLGSYHSGPASIFVATGNIREYWTVLNCSLWNATYEIEFRFPNNEQQVSLAHIQYSHPVGVDSLDNIPYDKPIDISAHNQGLNYQAIMECLGALLVGSVYRDYDNGFVHSDPGIAQTDLVFTKELFPVYSAATEIDAIELKSLPHFNDPLAPTIEQLFQNITLALFSKREFLQEAASATSVTISSSRSVYAYSSKWLILAYGLAVGLSFFAVLAGLWELWSSKASYSYKFSTVVRTTANTDSQIFVIKSHGIGTDPLPSHLKLVKIQVGTLSNASLLQSGEGVASRDEFKKPENVASDRSIMLSVESSREEDQPWGECEHEDKAALSN